MSNGRIRRLSLLVAVISCALVACGGAQSRLANHLTRGKDYFDAGSYQKASVEFRNALQIDPKNAEAQLMNGRVSEQLGDARAALQAYQTVIALQPAAAAGPAALGRLFVFAGAPDRALEIITPALAKNPADADLLTVRGAARLQQKDAAGALEDAEAAVKAAPQNENAIALLASLYRQQQRPDRAREIVARAVAARPKSVDLRQILAAIAFEMGDSAAAEKELRTVIELRPDELSHRTRLALFLARAKRLDDARRVLEDSVAALPANDEAKLGLADFLVAQGSREQGEKALRGFIARDAKNYELRLGLGALLQRAQANEEALAEYRSIVADDDTGPRGVIARDRIAAMQISAKDFAAARATIDDTLKLNPRDNDALTLRAGLALDQNDSSAAITDLRSVLRDQPQSVVVRRTLARAHVQNHEPALAEDVLREAMQLAPRDVAVRVDLAQLLGQTNRFEQAVTLLEDAVRQAPTDVAAREMLIKAYLATRNFAGARTAAEDLKTLRPDGASGFYLAGLAAQAQLKPDEAERELTRALELQPQALDALAAYVRLQASRGRIADAQARVRAVLDKDPHNAIARNLLGELLVIDKAYPAATEAFGAAIADASSWPQPYRNLALVKIAQQDAVAARAAYERALEPTKYSPEIVADLAALYERDGKPDAAIALYERLHQREPGQEVAANNLAMLLVTYRTDKSSLARARELTAPFASSDSGSLLDTSGWVRFKLGETQDALALLERAVSRSPDSRVIRYHLAMAQMQAGLAEKARTNLETALQGDTVFSGRDEARAALDDLKRRAG
jgi:tetratricopeptide (TPR) repeat protein